MREGRQSCCFYFGFLGGGVELPMNRSASFWFLNIVNSLLLNLFQLLCGFFDGNKGSQSG